MLMDENLIDAVADAYCAINDQYKSLSMTFADALKIAHTRKTKYLLEIELLKRIDHHYEKRRIKYGYTY